MHLPEPTDDAPVDRCTCCPFGCHLDLDFVSFAENVAAGRKIADPAFQNHRQTPNVQNGDTKRNGHREPTPPSAFRSLSKKSLNDVVNDLNEISRYAMPINGGEISTLPAKNLRHIEWSLAIEEPPVQHVPQFPVVDLHVAYSPMDSGYRDHESYREKTPLTVSAEQEVQAILGGHRSRQLPLFRRDVTSAPTSPVQKTYYTAIGQSLAKLSNRTPVSQISRVDPTFTSTTSTPRRSVGPSVTPSAAAAKPPLPRRYFEQPRRNRMLSPDPDTSASPNVLRSSNLHSRTYFRPQTSESPPSFPRSFPYRSRLGATSGSTGSPLFDSFVSVKRSRGIDESRSLSPLSSWEPPVLHKEEQPQEIPVPLVRPSAVGTQTPPFAPPAQPSRSLRDSPTQTPPLPPVKKSTPIHIGSQTNRVYSKNISVETTPLDFSSVGLDTADLQPPHPKQAPFTVEFQYCVGHEPEFQESIETNLQKRKQQREAEVSAVVRVIDAATLCRPISTTNQTQTDKPPALPSSVNEATTQTNTDWMMAEVRELLRAEKAERSRANKKTETEEEEAGEFILITCAKCAAVDSAHEQYEKIRDDDHLPSHPPSTRPLHSSTLKSSSSSSDPDEGLELIEPLDYETERREDEAATIGRVSPPSQFASISPRAHELNAEKAEDTRSWRSNRSEDRGLDEEEQEMLANLDHLIDRQSLNSLEPDRYSLDTDAQTVICLHPNADETQRQLDPSRAEAIRKLLTEPTRSTSAFQRESAANRSYRVDKSKAHDLDYIFDKHTATEKSSAEPSTPSHDPEKALTEMVVLKKFISLPSQFPDPVPARIPRPKFAKFATPNSGEAETPDEAAEEADKLTPLRSELQYADSWRNGMRNRRFRHHQYPNYPSDPTPPPEDYSDEDEETQPIDPNEPLTSSNSSLTSDEAMDNETDESVHFELTPPLKEALETLNQRLLEGKNEEELETADWSTKYAQHQWFNTTTKKTASADSIERFIDALEALSPQLMETVVNFVDQNGNSALHYVVSHENFDAISVLLDAKVCRVDETNKAGYSPVMLAALCAIKDETEMAIIQRLFERGNVNAKAVYHGQTALMLACSHGRAETTKLLLNSGADVNAQDIDGSTSLMCAAEHGHKELVKELLKNPNIDCSLTDCDDQTALSIAVENGHRDIGVLIYAHLNFSRMEQHESSGNV